MSVLIITYDLNREQTGGDREGLLQYIKTHSWARLSESSYAVATDKAPATVVEEARRYLDKNDNIYVINLKKPYSGWGPKDVNDWLEGGLRY
jgi:CRISPR/Cas system-associated endoribonuclease Cas2